MSSQTPIKSPPVAKSNASDHDDRDSASGIDAKQPVKQTATVTGLAAAETQRTEAVLGDYLLRLFGLRKGPKKDIYDVDAACTKFMSKATYGLLTYTDCYPTKHLGFRKHRRAQESLYPPAVGKLVCF